MGANGEHFSNTTFDIEADHAISQGPPPFEDIFRTAQDLKPFRGADPNETCPLEVRDIGYGDGGTLNFHPLQFSEN